MRRAALVCSHHLQWCARRLTDELSMNIRHMQSADLDFAAGCARDVGWASTIQEDFEGFLQYDPNGCFVAEMGGERIGVCIAINYGASGFIGNLIVIEEMRRRGIGTRLLEHAVEYLRSCGTQNVLLDGVPAAISLYERAGFRKICRSLRFAGQMRGQPHSDVRSIQAEDFEALIKLDRRAFGADRSFFLKHRWSLFPELGRIMCRNGEIAGFAMGRYGREVMTVGPWVVTKDVERPGALIEDLAMEVADLPINMGVLGTNLTAVATIRALGFCEHREPSWRMVLGSSGHLGSSDWSYAIGSPAKG